MLANGFKINECNQCVYVKDTKKTMLFCICMLMTCLLLVVMKKMVKPTNTMLNSKFNMKNMGLKNKILRV